MLFKITSFWAWVCVVLNFFGNRRRCKMRGKITGKSLSFWKFRKGMVSNLHCTFQVIFQKLQLTSKRWIYLYSFWNHNSMNSVSVWFHWKMTSSLIDTPLPTLTRIYYLNRYRKQKCNIKSKSVWVYSQFQNLEFEKTA